MKFVPKIDWNFQRLRKFPNTELFNNRKLRSDAQAAVADRVRGAQAAVRGEGDGGKTRKHFTRVEPQRNSEEQPKILRKATKENFVYDGTFQEAVASVFLVAEFFSFMPVKGVSAKHPSQLSFSWSNLRTCYTLLCIAAIFIDLAFTVNRLFTSAITFNNLEPVIFSGSSFVVCIGALNLARKWPGLMMKWHETENELPPYQSQAAKRRMAYRIKMVALVAMMVSLGEHLCFIISNIVYSRTCSHSGDPFKDFFLIDKANLFIVLPYSSWLAWAGKAENIICTFVWTYMDVFVITISIGLSSKFRQLNDNLLKFKGMQMPEAFWSERRIQYRNLCILCENMDNAISIITMISYSNNLYFICVQLLKSLNNRPSVVHTVYFYYSLLFLLGRAMAVSLYTADVNDESRKPLRILRCVPKESWCPEVKRFSEEINSDFVALSGMKFFHLTRKLILSVAGTIVTYELVLIQFHEDVEMRKCEEM